MIYRTCKGCAVDHATCLRRAEVERATAGAGITSIKFRCKGRQAFFSVGQRVAVSLMVYGYSEYEHGNFETEFRGTVISERPAGGRFLIKVDSGGSLCGGAEAPACLRSAAGFVTALSKRMRAIDEPSLSVCQYCQYTGGEHEVVCTRHTPKEDKTDG